MFTIDEYLQLFNISLSSTHAEIKVDELSTEIEDILSKINKVIKKYRSTEMWDGICTFVI